MIALLKGSYLIYDSIFEVLKTLPGEQKEVSTFEGLWNKENAADIAI